MRHIPVSPFLTERLNEGALAPTQWALRLLFFAALAALAGALLWPRRGRRDRSAAPWLSRALPLLLCAVWIHQGWWQLAGFAQPRFLAFLRRYDRRPTVAATRPVRGRILDARGETLAEDDPERPGGRHYPAGAAAAHVIGFIHPKYGLYGLEGVADAYLLGGAFSTPSERSRFGKNLLAARPRGNDLRLTLHGDLQRTAAQLLAGRRGAIVVLRPDDGAILAMASAPAFDPEDPAPALAANPDEAPMLHRAIHGRYPPGSSFKIVTAALAIERGERGALPCPAEGIVPMPGMRPIRDHEYYAAQREGRDWSGHGSLSLREAFVRSSNVYFAQVGLRTPPERMAELLDRIRASETLVLFEGSDGRVATRAGPAIAAADLHGGRRAQWAIGQGDLALTPFQMALIAAAVANEGWVWAPHLAADAARQPLGRFFKPATARELQALMAAVVAQGTGRRAAPPGISVAGKTGTAQNPRGEDHAWFVGFAPTDRPAVAFAVLIEHGGSGGQTAAPRAAELVAKAAQLGLLAPSGGGTAP